MRWDFKIDRTKDSKWSVLYPYVLKIVDTPADLSFNDVYCRFKQAEWWCEEQFGLHANDRWRAIDSFDFGFRDYVDVIAFKMRWG